MHSRGHTEISACQRSVKRHLPFLKAVNTLLMERAAKASSRPDLALAYLRAADKVIQVDDFAP